MTQQIVSLVSNLITPIKEFHLCPSQQTGDYWWTEKSFINSAQAFPSRCSQHCSKFPYTIKSYQLNASCFNLNSPLHLIVSLTLGLNYVYNG